MLIVKAIINCYVQIALVVPCRSNFRALQFQLKITYRINYPLTIRAHGRILPLSFLNLRIIFYEFVSN